MERNNSNPRTTEALRVAVRELARGLLGQGESLELHVGPETGQRIAGRIERKPTRELLNDWGELLADHGTGCSPEAVRSCCGRVVAILHADGGELVDVDAGA